eukprot:1312407-Ditylum_brightwellii.AAC.1
MQVTLEKLGHMQPPTPIHCNISTAVGIADNTIKQQRLCVMDMHYFWNCDQVAQGNFDVTWHPGIENLGDYPTKHHPPSHHICVCPSYLYEKNSSQSAAACTCTRQSVRVCWSTQYTRQWICR